LLYALVGSAEHVILGPLLGAAGFRYMTDSLGRLTSQSSMYIGLALLVVVYVLPNGILGLLDLAARRIPLRGGKQEPSPQPILHRREGLLKR
jgi:branched-chain amino acid transport system permease protein